MTLVCKFFNAKLTHLYNANITLTDNFCIIELSSIFIERSYFCNFIDFLSFIGLSPGPGLTFSNLEQRSLIKVECGTMCVVGKKTTQ